MFRIHKREEYSIKDKEKKSLFSAAGIVHHQLMNFLVHQLIANFGKAKISLLLRTTAIRGGDD